MDTADTRRSRRERAEPAEQAQDAPSAPPAGDETAEQQQPAEDAAPPAAGDETPAQAPEAEAVEEQDPIGVAVDAWFAGFNDSDLSRHPGFWRLVRDRLPELKAAIGAVPTA